MNPVQPARSSAVAERAGRCGAGLLIAIALACALGDGGEEPAPLQRAVLRIDPNTAPRAELMLLPDIGPARADALLAARHGDQPNIESIADLDRVRGIGPRRIEKLRPHIQLKSPAREHP